MGGGAADHDTGTRFLGRQARASGKTGAREQLGDDGETGGAGVFAPGP